MQTSLLFFTTVCVALDFELYIETTFDRDLLYLDDGMLTGYFICRCH